MSDVRQSERALQFAEEDAELVQVGPEAEDAQRGGCPDASRVE